MLRCFSTIGYTRFDLFKVASIHLIKLLPKPNFLSTARRKEWFNELKALSISVVAKKPSILKTSLISMISDINLPVSQINLCLTYAVCSWLIKTGRIYLSLSARAFEAIL